MNRSTIQLITIATALAAATASSAQTPKPSAAPAPSTSDAPAKPAAPVNSAITAPTDPNKVVLEINGEKMTAAQFDEMVKSFPPQVQQMANGPQRHDFIEQYITLRVASKEAEKQGISSRPAVKQQIALQRDQILAQALYQDLVSNTAVSDADAQKYYDEHKSDFETVKADHILIRFKGSPVPLRKDQKDLTEDEALAKAKEVQKRLLAGEDFTKVQKELSDDTSGPLPAFTHGQMVKEFEQAAFTLPIGKVSDPVKTTFGYHVIKVTSRESKSFDQAKAEILQKIRPQIAKKQMDDLRTKGNVTMDDAFFKASAPATK